ncbi:polyprenyl synthetase family protein [Dehalococcoidia bacterium]|nr:polyprenyl synthetase family protein [Dehalococcoidia bacterium]
MNLESLSLRYRPDLEAELRRIVGDSPLPLYHMMRYHLGWIDVSGQSQLTSGGKLLRPSLCLLSCESVGGDWHVALPAAAALELVHNFSLIHDDIEDESRERRGRPTVWSVWGQPQAINTGDAMHTLARLALLRLEGKDLAPGKILSAVRLLDETCLRLCEGQYLDMSYEERLDVSIDDYLEMIGLKTAALFECSLKLGALLGTDDERAIEGMGRFGRNLGLAFQIRDDVLGIWGEDKITGKPATDILKKKKALPVIYGIQRAGPEQRAEFLRVYSEQTIAERDVASVRQMLDRLGARQYASGVAGRYRQSALAELDETSISPSAKDQLRELAQFVVEREY